MVKDDQSRQVAKTHPSLLMAILVLAVVLSAVDKPLSDTIKSSSSLPGITGSYMLTGGTFGAPRRDG